MSLRAARRFLSGAAFAGLLLASSALVGCSAGDTEDNAPAAGSAVVAGDVLDGPKGLWVSQGIRKATSQKTTGVAFWEVFITVGNLGEPYVVARGSANAASKPFVDVVIDIRAKQLDMRSEKKFDGAARAAFVKAVMEDLKAVSKDRSLETSGTSKAPGASGARACAQSLGWVAVDELLVMMSFALATAACGASASSPLGALVATTLCAWQVDDTADYNDRTANQMLHAYNVCTGSK